MDGSTIFHFDEDKKKFESFAVVNGGRFWFARDFMKMLGYETFQSSRQAIDKAIGTCGRVGISVADNFIQVERQIEGEKHMDYKLSRFACYLTAMNGDTNKPQVAKAQTYLLH